MKTLGFLLGILLPSISIVFSANEDTASISIEKGASSRGKHRDCFEITNDITYPCQHRDDFHIREFESSCYKQTYRIRSIGKKYREVL